MMASHHPEGVPHHPGKRLSYFVVSQRFGCLGGIGFCAASWHQAAHDAFIGWSGRARVAHLGLVLNDSRFLLLPWASVPNLASHILSIVRRRLPEDWRRQYALDPVLIETFVETRDSPEQPTVPPDGSMSAPHRDADATTPKNSTPCRKSTSGSAHVGGYVLTRHSGGKPRMVLISTPERSK